jgi:NADH-ubiquinone oxidoreductase chain 1
LFCTLAETHRAPFDFAESESELVSGFNTEYGGAYFAFIFLSEYSVLIVSCYVIAYLFLNIVNVGLRVLRFLVISAVTFLVLAFTIWVRVTYVRFRYDLLIMAA